MTQTLGTNTNNDIYIGLNGNLVMLQGQSAVGAGCQSVSRASLGEEVLSITSGLPFFQAVFVGVPNLQAFNNALLVALQGVDGVVSVTNLTSKVTKDQKGKSVLTYTATIETQYGLTFTTTGEIPSP